MNMDQTIEDAFATVSRITGKSEAELQVMALKDRMDYPSNIL